MKKIFVLVCLTTLIFSSCSNDDDVIDNDTVGQTFEIDNVNFVGDDYTVNVPIPPSVDIVSSDVVLVYRLEEVVNNREVWEPLPTASFFFFNDTTGAIEGFLNYRYDFTIEDVDIILDFDLPNPNLLETRFTNNQVFRIVVVPAGFIQSSKIDFSDINEVKSALNLKF